MLKLNDNCEDNNLITTCGNVKNFFCRMIAKKIAKKFSDKYKVTWSTSTTSSSTTVKTHLFNPPDYT